MKILAYNAKEVIERLHLLVSAQMDFTMIFSLMIVKVKVLTNK
jgi:hypothetical protein